MTPRNETHPSANNTRDISLKELISNIKSAFRILWGYKFRILIIGLLGACIGFGYAHLVNKTAYTSRLTFAIEDKGRSSALSGIASQFGMDLGGAAGGGGLFSSDNVILLLRSNRIVQEALLTPLPVYNNETLLNQYLEIYYPKKKAKGKKLRIDPLKLRENFTRSEDSTLQKVTEHLVKNCINVTRLDKKAAIIAIEVKTQDEKFSYWLSRLLIDEATALYLELRVGKTRQTVHILEQRVDSVRRELNNAMTQAATQNDQNQALVLMRARVPAVKKQMEIQLLTTLYGELIKNLELTKFTLEREEPVIEVIDAPAMPLKMEGRKRLKKGFMFGVLFTVLASGYFFFRHWLSTETSEE